MPCILKVNVVSKQLYDAGIPTHSVGWTIDLGIY
jgi:hypothetical protein